MSLVFQRSTRSRLTAVVGALLSALLLTACRSAAQTHPTSTFDGKTAHRHVEELVAIGPRPPGSPGAALARAYISSQLSALGLTVREQKFTADTPIGPLPMVNLRAVVPGARPTGRLIVAGHYDTKLFRDRRFVGANDGGSSTAFLLELARVLVARKNPQPIELLFFDGEEAIVEWVDDDFTYGSRHYVEEARRDGTLADIRALVLVDMIGDRDLRIRREANSTDWLTDLIWKEAKRAGRTEFVDEVMSIEDDHSRFLEADIPAVNIIDLEYPAWHTEGDTLDKVSPDSLQVVADVLLTALPDIEQRIAP